MNMKHFFNILSFNWLLLLFIIFIISFSQDVSFKNLLDNFIVSDYCFTMDDNYNHISLLRGGKICHYHLENGLNN
jgi:hypothetical protein